jgi:3-methyladenine DNA glycosylase/8-oxoguanine DNA glycosylase
MGSAVGPRVDLGSAGAMGSAVCARSGIGLGSAVAGAAPASDGADPDLGGLSWEWRAPFTVDIGLTLAVHARGPGDPTFRVDEAGAIWRTSLTPEGPATLRLTSSGPRPRLAREAGAARPLGPAAGLRLVLPPTAAAVPGPLPVTASAAHDAAAAVDATGICDRGIRACTHIRATAWGPGARWVLAQVPDLLGVRDEPADFRPRDARLSELTSRFAGFRVGRTERVFEALVPAVLEQKVLSLEAHRAWRLLLRWHGLPAPGPALTGMRVSPPPATWRSVPSWDWHRAGVEAVRARTIAGAALVAARLEAAVDRPACEFDRMLRSLPGIGPWTSAEIRQRASGDADAVSVGDYHLPNVVSWTLTGEPGDDDRMLELLAPYAGHRYRATRIIEMGGSAPPRRGPRLAVRDYRGF